MDFFKFFRKEKPIEKGSSFFVKIDKASANAKEQAKNYERGSNKLATTAELNYFHTSELVFSCVDYVGKAASQATPKIGKIGKEGKVEALKTKDPLNTWIKAPNPFCTWGEMIELSVQGILLGGTSFMTMEMNKGKYESWFLGTPAEVTIVPDETNYIDGFLWKDKVAYDVDEVCFMKNSTLNNVYYGVPAVRPLLDTLNLESYAITDLSDFYKNSSMLTGLLKSEYPLSPEQITSLREQFKALYGTGGAERGGTVVLPGGLSYFPIQSNPSDSKILDSLVVSEKRVLRTFKINPIVLGGESISTNKPHELMKAVFNTAVRPYLYKIQDNITLFLRNKFKDDTLVFYFDFDRVVELDTSLDIKANAAKTCYSTGLATLNEARDMIGLDKIVNCPNADKNILAVYLVGSGATYIQDGTLPDVTETVNDGGVGGAGSTNPNGGTPDMPTKQ